MTRLGVAHRIRMPRVPVGALAPPAPRAQGPEEHGAEDRTRPSWPPRLPNEPHVGQSRERERRGGEPTKDPRRCGPDVTDWFFEELILHWNYSVAQYDSHGWWRFHSKSSYADFAKYANSLDYKFMTFKGTECPRECVDTVTLCGTCMHRSELGNLMFGVVGRVWGFYYFQLRLGTWWKGAGLAEDWDRAAAETGYETADGSAAALTASAASMCTTLKAHARWANIQAPEVKDCPPCDEVWKGPHSTPGIPCAFPGVASHG